MSSNKMSSNKMSSTIGSTEYVGIASIQNVPAKIDTGADSSAVWASHIRVTKDGILRFRLFDKQSPFYTGKGLRRTDFKAAVIRSSSGHEQIRYRTHITTTINGRKIRVLFNLSDRSKNNFPVLIGRRTIAGKFLVDVSQKHTTISAKKTKTKAIQRQLEKNPYRFHRKYIKKFSGDGSLIKLSKKELR